MDAVINSRRRYLIDNAPSVVAAVLTFINCVYIWSNGRPLQEADGSISFCVVCPWFDTWSFTNEPSVLFVAALFLLFNTWIGAVATLVLSGSILFNSLFLIARTLSDYGVRYYWENIGRHEGHIFLTQEFQGVIAGIVFTIAAVYLVKRIYLTTVAR